MGFNPADEYRIQEFEHWPHDIPSATEQDAGVMSAADKTKLDGLVPGGGGFKNEGKELFSVNGLSYALIVLATPHTTADYRVFLAAGRSGPFVPQPESIIPNYQIVDNQSFYIYVSSPFDGSVSWGTSGAV